MKKTTFRLFTREKQLVGAYVPQRKSEHLGLLAILSDTSKTELINGLLVSFIENRMVEEGGTLNVLKKIARKALSLFWISQHKHTPSFRDYTAFEIHTRQQLIKKHIASKDIQRIISEMQTEFREYKHAKNESGESVERTSGATQKKTIRRKVK